MLSYCEISFSMSSFVLSIVKRPVYLIYILMIPFFCGAVNAKSPEIWGVDFFKNRVYNSFINVYC